MISTPHFTTSDYYANLLQTSSKTPHLSVGKSIHAQIIKQGLLASVYLLNNLLNLYVKCGLTPVAHQLFDEMPVKNMFSCNTIVSGYAKGGRMGDASFVFRQIQDPDSVSWTSMIVGYYHLGYYGNALKLFLGMIKDGVSPTQFTITSVLAACANMRDLNLGRKVHSFVVKHGLGSYVPVANSLFNMYVKVGDHVRARVIFDRMRIRNVSSWNSMISLHIMSGRVDLARLQFDQMVERDIVSWNSIITGYNQRGFHLEALQLFAEMLKDSSLEPDKFTLASAISACASLENLELGKQIHAYMIRTEFNICGAVENSLITMYSKCGGVENARKIIQKNGISNLNVIAFTTLMDGYVKLGDIRPAREIFDSLKDRDVIAWTAMIVGYEQNGFDNDAVELFRLMLKEGPRPNNYTLAAMLSVISSLAFLEHGKQIHAVAIRSAEVSSVSVSNALITMYAKAGSIARARRVFSHHHCRDSVTWTSMIIALAQHGFGEEAIELFEEMLVLDIKPDHVTYVGVLVACTHVGLVEEGKSYYNMMQNVHKIKPTASHYSCMVDLLGRAGLLQEVQDFVKKMPIEPDNIAWGSILASCNVHKNVELAKVAAERLLLLDPGNSGAFASLANIYSACGKWAEAAKVRKSMKKKGIKKDQGLSWLQVKNEVHVFGSEDALHPQREAIFTKMAKIWDEIKKMGFVPDTGSVLHDLDDEAKEHILKHHSEKLAIAFGLLNTPNNTTLTIMKNLRVCNDCHSAIKFISKLVSREIILRDATRFHHFKDGVCSCRDYW
ncbi:hypothetical protein SOVF_210000 [Spinacia oleracea]|uniref:Pentatricopeptide repeat-containing protein At2g22070 n=1 Tax=Spinacia oleracea TaxID=3562 RepID=A0A9R0IKA7_SPIOL|nr:pentatricopeptide repeat-containing protein At2g22070 [Spinacia oleracea]KNA03358.1 hypothetical protein SOVF_210000 [Spinacia oleracea]